MGVDKGVTTPIIDTLRESDESVAFSCHEVSKNDTCSRSKQEENEEIGISNGCMHNDVTSFCKNIQTHPAFDRRVLSTKYERKSRNIRSRVAHCASYPIKNRQCVPFSSSELLYRECDIIIR